MALPRKERSRRLGDMSGHVIALERKKQEIGRYERAMALPWKERSRRMGEMSGQWYCPGTEEEGDWEI